MPKNRKNQVKKKLFWTYFDGRGAVPQDGIVN